MTSPLGPKIMAQIFTHAVLPFLTSALPLWQPPMTRTQIPTYTQIETQKGLPFHPLSQLCFHFISPYP